MLLPAHSLTRLEGVRSRRRRELVLMSPTGASAQPLSLLSSPDCRWIILTRIPIRPVRQVDKQAQSTRLNFPNHQENVAEYLIAQPERLQALR
jgi:hypothetical protein